jgi:hypothetical protein
MVAERGASDGEINVLFAQAVAAESAGDLHGALTPLEHAIAHVEARGKRYQYLYEWRARLEGGLGEHDRAESSLVVARDIAQTASGEVDGDRLGVFRMDVARAERAIAVMDLPRAEELLSGLRDDAGVLGPVTVERCGEIIAWLRRLTFYRRPAPNLAIPRVEAALALAGIWAERGKYRSALRLVEAIEPDLAGAEIAIRIDEVRLFEIELRLEAGQIHRAHDRAASLAPAGDALGRVRQALVRARIGLTAGRLRDAYDRLDELATAPTGDPSLFASAAATRAAIFVELNLWRRAQEVAADAVRRLGSGPAVEPLVQLLTRAQHNAGTRGRSVMAVWELPFEAPDVAARRRARPSVSLPSQAVGAPWRLASAWTGHANRVLEALEQRDLAAAAQHQAALEAITAGVESDYIAARVRLSALLIAYCGAPSPATLEALCSVAEALHELGARGAEAQATRYSAWAAAKLGRRDDYVGLARRSSAIIEEIARELPPVERGLYLTNKWNGRDELVAARLRELLDGGAADPRTPSRRELCQVFREIDVLTHWAIDHAFGDRRAEALLDATSDEIVPWVRETLLTPPMKRGGFRLRSPLSLWRLPARTLILHYHVLPDRTYLFRIARGHIDMVPLPLGRVHLRTDMRALLDDPEALVCLAQDAGVAGALERFPGIRRLVIVPHDAMANLPFAALPVGGEPLCTRVAISQLDRLERLRRRRWFRRSGRCVSVGLSSYAGSGARDLPAAEDEAHAVSVLAGAGSIVTGDAASCDGVLEALRGAARVHIAAHGSVGSDNPALNGILLRDGEGYRTLSLHELRRAGLQRLQLVTLATCRSAESALLPGGERICLPTALLDAGARGVIAALWPVDDTASVEVMTALYRHLHSERPSVALARTQAELRDRPAQRWAGLVFYGND